jgi:hypothetical protein
VREPGRELTEGSQPVSAADGVLRGAKVLIRLGQLVRYGAMPTRFHAVCFGHLAGKEPDDG